MADALRGVGVEAVLLDADAQLLPRLIAEGPDAVFIAVARRPRVRTARFAGCST